MRILIAGYPKTGKTTLAARLAAKHNIPTILHTDDLVGKMSWKAQSKQVRDWIATAGSVIIEGVTVTRGLRKYLADFQDAAVPVDKIYFLKSPLIPLTLKQGMFCVAIRNAWHDCLCDYRMSNISRILELPSCQLETDLSSPARSSKSTKPHTQSEPPEPSTP